MSRQFDTPERMAKRKNDHIEICLHQDVESSGLTFDALRFRPEALPDFDLAEVDSSAEFLGERFSLPLLITGMTGGVDRGEFINRVLAQAASEIGIPMGLGSQKMMLANPGFKRLFDVRKVAPRAFLIGNLGLGCFNTGVKIDDVRRMVDDMGLNAMAFHLNALQESIQPEGETNFTGLLNHLEVACKTLGVPVMVKEVGSGVSADTALRLARAGVHALDVGGNTGTSWGFIEGQRGTEMDRRLGELFRNWGLSTPESLVEVLSVLRTQKSATDASAGRRTPSSPRGERETIYPQVVATGGIRNGMHVAKAVAVGATMAGVGLPLLRCVLSGGDDEELAFNSVMTELEFFSRGLKIAQFVTGSKNLYELPAALMNHPLMSSKSLEDYPS